MQVFRVGTRRSALAMTQTAQVVEALSKLRPEDRFEVRAMVTRGDRIQDVALSEVGGKGLFVSEMEAALLAGELDFAVHSLKDVPAELAEGLVIGCIPERRDPRDVLISREGFGLRDLPPGAAVGTSSLRRAGQIQLLRPDLRIVPVRGNIDTRLRKLDSGLHAVVLAAAGLLRMGWWDGDRLAFPGFPPHGGEAGGKPGSKAGYRGIALTEDEVLPAAGQGAIAVECRADDSLTLALLESLHHRETAAEVAAERDFLRRVGGDCKVPVAAFAQLRPEPGRPDAGVLRGWIGTPDGKRSVADRLPGSIGRLGEDLAARMLAKGGGEILSNLRAADGGPSV